MTAGPGDWSGISSAFKWEYKSYLMGVRVDLTAGVCLIYLKWLLKGAVKVLLFRYIDK